MNKERGKVEEVEILQNFSFTSARRRMGIIVKETDGASYCT